MNTIAYYSLLELARYYAHIRHYGKTISLYNVFQQKNKEIADIINVNKKIIQNRYQSLERSYEYKDIILSIQGNIFEKITILCKIPYDIVFTWEQIDDHHLISIKFNKKFYNEIVEYILNNEISFSIFFEYEKKSIVHTKGKENATYYQLYKNTIETKNTIAFICDENFITPTIVAINSCIANSMCTSNIYIIAVNCAKKLISKIKICDNSSTNIYIIDVKNSFSDIDSFKNLVTSAALYKFLLPKILYNKDTCLYLDSDTICLNSLCDIFTINLENIYAAVVEDIVGIYEHKEHRRIHNNNYFNSGVMFLNLKKLRDNNLSDTMIQMKLTSSTIKYMDQDVFNISFEENVKYIDPYYNYMTTNTRLDSSIFKQFFTEFNPENIHILHYSYKKPWNEAKVQFSHFWHEEYRRVWGKCHQNATYATRPGTTDRYAEYYKKAHIRKNSVLIIEAADCHGEVIPGFASYFYTRGFNVDIIMTNNNFMLNPLSRLTDHSIRVYHNDKYSLYKFLDTNKLNNYSVILFTSRSLYYKIGDNTHPTIYEYFKDINPLQDKIISLEHHLEFISPDIKDKIIILANPQRTKALQHRTVNFPCYGNIKKKTKKNKITTFTVIGNIEKSRKNYDLLINNFLTIDKEYSIEIVARRGSLDIPQTLQDKFNLTINASYEKLYQIVERSDFILALLDPTIEDHKRYLTCGTSGTFQLIYGFRKPCILHKDFADCYFLDQKNSIIYNNNDDLHNALLSSMEMDNMSYSKMVESLEDLYYRIYTDSANNFTKIAKEILYPNQYNKPLSLEKESKEYIYV